jgi:hypothetical protein
VVAGEGRTVPLRNSEHSLDTTLNATHDPANAGADGTSHRPSRAIAGRSSLFRAPNDALSLRCQGHGKSGEDTGGHHQTTFHLRSPWVNAARIIVGVTVMIHIIHILLTACFDLAQSRREQGRSLPAHSSNKNDCAFAALDADQREILRTGFYLMIGGTLVATLRSGMLELK